MAFSACFRTRTYLEIPSGQLPEFQAEIDPILSGISNTFNELTQPNLTRTSRTGPEHLCKRLYVPELDIEMPRESRQNPPKIRQSKTPPDPRQRERPGVASFVAAWG